MKKTHTVSPPFSDLREMLHRSAAAYRSKTALRERHGEGYEAISYKKLMADAEALATALSMRFARDTRVLLVGNDCYAWVLAFLALSCGSGVPMPVDPATDQATLSALAAKTGANAVIYAADQAKKCAALGLRIGISFDELPLLVGEGSLSLMEWRESAFAAPIVKTRPAAIFFTANGHGAVFSHQALSSALRGFAASMRFSAGDTLLAVLPFYGTAACVQGLLAPLSRGASVTVGKGISELLGDLRAARPTALVCTPVVVEALATRLSAMLKKSGKADTRPHQFPVSLARQGFFSVERALFGGRLHRIAVLGNVSVFAQKTLYTLGVTVLECYSVPECAGLAACNRMQQRRPGTAGLALPGSVIDIDNVGADNSGDIRCRGENVFSAYLGEPNRTANVLERGWFYTGDVGRVDADGFLHVLGRRENRIAVARNRFVSPEALEKKLLQNPLLAEVAVVGIPTDDKTAEPVAVCRPALAPNESDTDIERAVGEWVAEVNETASPDERIAFYVLHTAPLPRTAAGHIDRAALARTIGENS